MFDLKIKEIKSTAHTNDGSFLQTPFWCEFKQNHGWKYQRFEIVVNMPVSIGSETLEERTFETAVLTRSFAKGLFSLAYVPLFPSLPYERQTAEDEADDSQTIEFSHLIYDIARALKSFLPKNCICIRFDPAVELSSPELRDDFNYGIKNVCFADHIKLKKNKVDIQPPDSTQIDLTGTEEEILNRMKSKWRYNINLSARKGVEIEKVSGDTTDLSAKLDIFYDLYKITAERDGIAIHAKSYYDDLLKRSADQNKDGKKVPEINLYIAKHEEDYLGAIITLFSQTESIYLYGCSSNTKRNLMPNFLLQWTAMKDAKAYGSKYYDMYGMPPTDDENHPMHGLYLFKTGFGGKNIHRIGSWDVPLKGMYGICTAGEKLRAFWHKKVLKKIRHR